MQLYIGNKNYSSWSMRPWVLLKQTGIVFDEVRVRFDSFDADSEFKKTILKVNPLGKVPVLVDGDLVVTDTLAICEYLADSFPEKNLWPKDKTLRALARSACAEMHAGFGALRSSCPMNIEAHLPEVGALAMRDRPAVVNDLNRLQSLWMGLLKQYASVKNEGMLFGNFSIADAYFAPVVMRLKTYALPVSPEVSAYVMRVYELEGVKAWMSDALLEKDFLDFEEPYRLKR